MAHHRTTHTLIAALSIAITGSAGLADILHDTTGFNISSNWLVGHSTVSSTINQPADSFVISGGDFTLDNLTLSLGASSLATAEPDDYEIRIWSNTVDIDTGLNEPGTLLETFTVFGSDSITGDTIVTSSLNPVLEDGQTYWVSVALPDDQSSGFWQSVDTPSNGRAVAFSGDAGAEWFATTSPDAMYLRVDGTLVPTPASLALAGMGGLFITRRRR